MDFSTNVQALNAIGLSRQVGANNIANMNTDEFKSSRVSLETGHNGQGVRVASVDKTDTPGPLHQVERVREDEDGNITRETEMVEGSNTDLTVELTSMIKDENAFKANVAAIRAKDEMTGTLLNTLA